MFDFNADPGTGNLNARAYLASVVGPRRIAQGQRTVKPVPTTKMVQLLRNVGSVEALYFECWLPQQDLLSLAGGGALLSFSGSDNGGGENGYQLVLTATQRYSGVLLPNEQLFATTLTDATGGPLIAPVSLIIASVGF
jgi:hypothetical protein